MDDQRAQVIEKIKTSNNFLVTVSTNPTVDQLAAAIGLTLLLGKLGKQATAVFSGEVPPVIRFLKPDKTLQKSPDNLQDFIISLDKSKADRLRYKVDDDVVRIFITPYKTSLSSKDLTYSKGDFNVDTVLALGVARKDDLDTAITSHGRILHDATVISMTNTDHAQLGTLHLENTKVSGMSELVFGLIPELGHELVDEPIATALLTGIVASTDHFGNDKTTPMTLTASADLLEAGANQQLVATQIGHKDGQRLGQGGPSQPLKSYKQIASEQVTDTTKNSAPQTKELPPVAPEEVRTPPIPPSAAPLTSPAPQFAAQQSSVIEMPPAPDRPSPADLSTVPPTPTPMIDTDKTLADLEAAVNSPHAAQPEVSSDVDSARQAVENALGASSEPPVDMGAQESGLNLEDHDSVVPGVVPDTVPPVAPPVAPPVSAALPTEQVSQISSPTPLNPAANEQAPLRNSPADQPFTMPLPPAPASPPASTSDPAGPPPGPPPIPPTMPPAGPGMPPR